jgi:hypothetical protein
MAAQSTDAEVRARWSAMAEEVLKRFEIEPARKISLTDTKPDDFHRRG